MASSKFIELTDSEKELYRASGLTDFLIDSIERTGYTPPTWKYSSRFSKSIAWVNGAFGKFKYGSEFSFDYSKGGLILANHVSYPDIPFIISNLYNHLGGEIYTNPPLFIQRPGFFTKWGLAIPIIRPEEFAKISQNTGMEEKEFERDALKLNNKLLRGANRLIHEQNKVVVLFPQGTRNGSDIKGISRLKRTFKDSQNVAMLRIFNTDTNFREFSAREVSLDSPILEERVRRHFRMY